MSGSMVDIQSPTAEIRRGKKERRKEERKKKEETTWQKYNGRSYYKYHQSRNQKWLCRPIKHSKSLGRANFDVLTTSGSPIPILVGIPISKLPRSHSQTAD